MKKIKKIAGIGILLLFLLFMIRYAVSLESEEKLSMASAGGSDKQEKDSAEKEKDFIRWAELNAPLDAMNLAYQADLDTYGTDCHIKWTSLLAYGAAKTGGEFGKLAIEAMKNAAERVKNGETVWQQEIEGMSQYEYYREVYETALGGMVGVFLLQEENEYGELVWHRKYGLKAYSPIAKGFPYSDFDDFGSSRSYGYKRRHLGHDMMGQVGTPIIAVESGYVEVLGWNQYGGWRIGIRSFDKKRYYYYAHLRQDFPYAEGLKEGSVVTAGDVIGYMGHTGYSTQENVNNIKTVHLHWGLELIFDESQKESDNEIWVDCYQLSRFLYQNQSKVQKVEGTKEWKRIYDLNDPAVSRYLE